MAVQLARRRFTRAEYHKMVEAGILEPRDRVELIDGEIVEMSPIGPRHMACVARLNRFFTRGVGDDAIVQIQGSIALEDEGEPEPDVVLLRPRADFYATAIATAEDTLLIVEVADSSETYDRLTKTPQYAWHGIPELWLVDLNRDRVTVSTGPSARGYTTTRVYRRGESLSPLAFPDLSITVDDILG
jgi:Uma2 family endonuclease